VNEVFSTVAVGESQLFFYANFFSAPLDKVCQLSINFVGDKKFTKIIMEKM